MALQLPPLYGILDPEQIGERNVDNVLDQLLAGGIQWLQLRVKALPPIEFFHLARRVRSATADHGCKLIINDRVDIALACGADGVHLGQEDLPLRAGKKLMGSKIIGISTHDLEQAQTAESGGADYIGFGPMFGTATKNTGYDARGIAMLRQIRAAVSLPIVAIGGINEQNVQQVWSAGANSAAIISDILRAEDIGAKVSRLLRRHEALLSPGAR
jgi:thiamine-phosphate diphosphorylase